MVSKIQLISAGFFLFFIFVFFSFLVHKNLFDQVDFNTTVIVQDHISRRVDALFSVFSEIGKFEVMVVLLMVFLFAARRIIGGLAALGFFLGLHLFELFGKFYVDHPPPPHFMLRTQSIADFPQFYVSTDNSYPSGHAGRTMFLSVILLYLIWKSKIINRPIKVVLSGCVVLFDIIMLVSRVYLGEHWFSDVIGGSMLGLSLGLLSVFLLVFKWNINKYFKVKA